MSNTLVSQTSSLSSMQPSIPTSMRWYDGLAKYQQRGVAHVLATVVAVNGSAPRELQSKMIVTLDDCCDTLGGGSLEHDVTITARKLLKGELDTDDSKSSKPLREGKSEKAQTVRRDAVYTKHYPLGAKLAQCCGGSVTVMFECFNVTPPMSLLVFGAGHVAAALMTILADLPCQVDWVDSRAEMFERYVTQDADAIDDQVTYQLPAHIRPHIEEDPVDFVRPFIANSRRNAAANKGSQYFILVMTHDHSLDFDLVRAALDASIDINADADAVNTDDSELQSMPYLGCISSKTKENRFRTRLLQRGYSEQAIAKLTMPIGLEIGGKEPMAVAVSIAAQVLQLYHRA
ncbi:xanthine dehydrogenase accessory protein XdhC [Psychrobacter sp. NZS113]|uniref:xanthine dehydrogenase accessory protein XdhC n=1 Tax=Psychrobacter sp. NZS113 TaxID=2792045 RepID=UPI002A0A32F1|nr:xanthine dehydrogenase accessory protein XdhC [Psychrobacter sp. NZS113]